MWRLALPCLIALALASPTLAHAGDDDPLRWPDRTTGVTLGVAARYLGDQSVGGPGLGGEVAWGWGRWQALVDGRASWYLGDLDHDGGPALRVGGGARWLARSFQPDSSAALQLYLDAGAAVEHVALPAGGLTVPSLWAGWGWQVRAMSHHRRLMIRFWVRVELSPPLDRQRVADVLCRGTCATPVRATLLDDGFSGGLGVAW